MRLVRLTALLTAILLVAGFSSSISASGVGSAADPAAAPGQCGLPGLPPCPTPATGLLIQIAKSASPASLPAGGGLVTYTYTVTNGGSVPIGGIVVTDNKCAPVTFVGGDTNGNTLLEFGEVWTYTCTTMVTVTTTNTATAQGFSSSGLGSAATASATVTVAGCPPGTNCPTPTPCPPAGANCPTPTPCPPTSPNCPTPTPTPCPPGTTNCPPPTGKLCVTKFNDLNGNGFKAVAEPVLAGVTFTINPAVPPVSQVTPATGQVCWTVPAGVYTITESGPATANGWVPTTPVIAPSKSQTVAVPGGLSVSLLFGDHKFLIDHFQCYSISPTTLPASFVGLILKDQFASRTASAIKRLDLCNPTRKILPGTTVPITNASAHLACYQPSTQPTLPTTNSLVRVTNQFGNDTLRVLRPIALCLPTGKSVTTTYPAIPTGLGHYLCYSIQDLTPRTYSPVILVDQFGTQQSKVIRPVALCAPVRKTYQGKAYGVLNATDHLVCYGVTPSTFSPKSVLIRNQFERVPLRVIKPIQLCVPSLKRHIQG